MTASCHPENPHAWGPIARERDWGKRGEGSASRATSIRTNPSRVVCAQGGKAEFLPPRMESGKGGVITPRQIVSLNPFPCFPLPCKRVKTPTWQRGRV